MKKVFAIVLLLAIVVASLSVFVACGGNTTIGANFDVPEGGYDGSEVTIMFYHTMGQTLTPVLDSAIERFNKLYPNIHVEYDSVGGYDDVRDQIKTEINAGNQPNIAYCYPDHVALYNMSGAVVQLDNLINSEIEITRNDGTTEVLGLTDAQIADFIEGYYNEGKTFGDDFMYTLPMSKSTEVLYYNKTFFEENNLSVPTTWDEMEALCRKIKTIDPQSTPLGYDSEANWFITMCEQMGSGYTSSDPSNHFIFDNDQNKDFIKKIRTWFKDGLFTTQEIYGTYTSGLFTDTTLKSRSYMSIGSSAGATHQRPDADANGKYPFEVGIAPIPQLDKSNPKAISQGPSLCIFNKENSQEVVASWLFVKFLTTEIEFQAEFSKASGYIPVLKSVSSNAVYSEFINTADGYDNVAALSVKVGIEQQNSYYTSPAFNGSSKARDMVGELLVACITTDVDINQAFASAVGQCEYYIS